MAEAYVMYSRHSYCLCSQGDLILHVGGLILHVGGLILHVGGLILHVGGLIVKNGGSCPECPSHADRMRIVISSKQYLNFRFNTRVLMFQECMCDFMEGIIFCPPPLQI